MLTHMVLLAVVMNIIIVNKPIIFFMNYDYKNEILLYIIEMCSGITRGRVLSRGRYAQRFQKLI